MIDVNANEFHHNNWTNSDGSCARFRRNGATQTWKRDPERVRIPVKRGLYEYGQITNGNMDMFHMPGDCPDCRTKSR